MNNHNKIQHLKIAIGLSFLFLASISVSQTQQNSIHKEEVILKDTFLCKIELKINATNNYRLAFKQVFPVLDSETMNKTKGDTIHLTTISTELVKLFIANTKTYEKIKGDHSDLKLGEIADQLSIRLKAYIANFFNDKNALEWGMSEDNFAEMELYEKKIDRLNDTIAKIKLHKKWINTNTKARSRLRSDAYDKTKADGGKEKVQQTSTTDKPTENRQTNNANRPVTPTEQDLQSKKRALKDSLILLRAAKRELVTSIRRLKHQKTQPIVALSGSAFSFLNKNVDNDSLKGNIMAVGIHAQMADLWDMDVQLTLGQNEDVIESTDRNAFGSTVLIPGIRRYSFLSNYRLNSFWPYDRLEWIRKIGGSIGFNVSQVQWQWNSTDSTRVNNGKPIRVIPIAIDLCVNYNFLKVNKNRTNILANTKLSTEVGLATRWVGGDAGLSKQYLKQFLGTANQSYFGLLLGFRVQVDRMTVFYSGVLFPNSWYGNVSGLTGGQVISRIGLRADIFQYKKQGS